MKILKKVRAGIRYCVNLNYRTIIDANRGKYNSLDDEEFLKKKFFATMHRKLNLDDPQTFNEKLQWLKLNNRKPEYTMMVDKYLVRGYVADKLGEEYLIPLLGVWDTPEKIDFNSLPEQFVLKCNHNSGEGMCICKNRSELDVEKVKKNLEKGLRQDYFLPSREWPYKNVPRKIIAEQFMEAENNGELKDYKLWCFNGEPYCTLVCSDRFSGNGLHEDFFDMQWNHLALKRPSIPNATTEIPRPAHYEEMQMLARKLAAGIPFVRIDFYEINDRVYFGEITFFPASGFVGFEPEEWDQKLGEMVNLDLVSRK